MAALVAWLVLGAVLVVVARGSSPRTELLVALGGALLVVATGALPVAGALDTARELGPTLGFLAAIFVVAALAGRAGLFDRAGALVRGQGSSARRMVLLVAAIGGLITVALSLDATVVLFTPVVLHAVGTQRRTRDAALLTTTQVANASSLWLPVSNLTNLLVLPATGLTFAGFAARMTVPTVAAWGVVTWVGARGVPVDEPTRAPGTVLTRIVLDRFGIAVAVGLGVLLGALVVLPSLGVDAALVAGTGAAVLALAALVTRRMRPPDVVRATAPPFLAFVLALGIVVAGAREHGLGDAVARVIPSGDGLLALLAIAGAAALLANLVNNLPATLVLLTVVPHGAVAALLAMLVGVNVGPNVTYSGSLATLLWRRVVRAAGVEPDRSAFYRFGWTATPVALGAAVLGLWLTLRVV